MLELNLCSWFTLKANRKLYYIQSTVVFNSQQLCKNVIAIYLFIFNLYFYC